MFGQRLKRGSGDVFYNIRKHAVLFYTVLVWGELVLYAIFQPCLGIYGGQFPQLEEHIVPGSEVATSVSNRQLPLIGFEPSGEGRVVSKRDALTTRPMRPRFVYEFFTIWILYTPNVSPCLKWHKSLDTSDQQTRSSAYLNTGQSILNSPSFVTWILPVYSDYDT